MAESAVSPDWIDMAAAALTAKCTRFKLQTEEEKKDVVKAVVARTQCRCRIVLETLLQEHSSGSHHIFEKHFTVLNKCGVVLARLLHCVKKTPTKGGYQCIVGTYRIYLAPNFFPPAAVARAMHCSARGHGFDSQLQCVLIGSQKGTSASARFRCTLKNRAAGLK